MDFDLLRFGLVCAWFEAFTRKHNQVLTLSSQVLCYAKHEIVAVNGWDCVLRGIYASSLRN
jgi:hypothetical protein